jgi:hypothetical protein
MFKPVYLCDECRAEKKEANHWLALRETKDRDQTHSRLEIRAFDDASPNDSHICGSACMIKAVSRFAEEMNDKVEGLKAESEALDAAILEQGVKPK